MTYISQITTADATFTTGADHGAYMTAYVEARDRAAFSYFDQHIILDEDGRYWVADEGDYECLMQDLVDRIVHSVDAGRSDEN